MIRHDLLLAVRRLAVLPPAAFAVHWLRYELSSGGHAGQELALTGHAYLDGLLPWIGLAGLVALAASGARLRRMGAAGDRQSSAGRAWLGLTAVLVGAFVAQELLEALFAAGHPPGLGSVFADGGLWVIPAAALVAGILVLTRRGEHTLARLLCGGTLRSEMTASRRETSEALPAPHTATPPARFRDRRVRQRVRHLRRRVRCNSSPPTGDYSSRETTARPSSRSCHGGRHLVEASAAARGGRRT